MIQRLSQHFKVKFLLSNYTFFDTNFTYANEKVNYADFQNAVFPGEAQMSYGCINFCTPQTKIKQHKQKLPLTSSQISEFTEVHVFWFCTFIILLATHAFPRGLYIYIGRGIRHVAVNLQKNKTKRYKWIMPKKRQNAVNYF